MGTFKNHKFKREEHVYVNNEFSELLKDAVRFFHGTPVLSLPLEESFKSAGVYAIYCISKKGLYKTYGEKINRLSYDVPIYVGKAVPSGKSFSSLLLNEQLDFWQSRFRATLMMTPRDFAFRVLPIRNQQLQNRLFSALVGLYRPVWNQIFKVSSNVSGMASTWRSYHDIRFAPKADDSKRSVMQEVLETYFAAS